MQWVYWFSREMASVDSQGHISGSTAWNEGGEASQATGIGTLYFVQDPSWVTDGRNWGLWHPDLEPEVFLNFSALLSSQNFLDEPLRPNCCSSWSYWSSMPQIPNFYLIYFFNLLTFLVKPYRNNNCNLSANTSQSKRGTRVWRLPPPESGYLLSPLRGRCCFYTHTHTHTHTLYPFSVFSSHK